ncbi:MAG: hypothetical protein AAGD43_21055 [Pseudomonadota bacterium]
MQSSKQILPDWQPRSRNRLGGEKLGVRKVSRLVTREATLRRTFDDTEHSDTWILDCHRVTVLRIQSGLRVDEGAAKSISKTALVLAPARRP